MLESKTLETKAKNGLILHDSETREPSIARIFFYNKMRDVCIYELRDGNSVSEHIVLYFEVTNKSNNNFT